MPGSSVFSLLEFVQIHVHGVGDAVQSLPPSSTTPFSSSLDSFSASGSFPMNRLFASGGRVLELQLQDQFFQ